MATPQKNIDAFDAYAQDCKRVDDVQYEEAKRLNFQLVRDLRSLIAEDARAPIAQATCHQIVNVVDSYRARSTANDDSYTTQIHDLRRGLINTLRPAP